MIAQHLGIVGALTVEVLPFSRPPTRLEINNVGNANIQNKSVTLYTNGNGRPATGLTWSSSDERIVTIGEAGALTLRAPGNVRITASVDGLSDYYWMGVPPRSR